MMKVVLLVIVILVIYKRFLPDRGSKKEYYLPIKNDDKIKKVNNKFIEAPYSPSQNYMIQYFLDSHNRRRCEWVKNNIDIIRT